MADPLANLAGPVRALRAEPPDAQEIEGLLRTGTARLRDARNAALAIESRFDLASSSARSGTVHAQRCRRGAAGAVADKL